MAAFEPFEPAVKTGAAGFTQTLALGAGAGTSQTINIPASVSNGNNSLLVTLENNNTTGNINAYVRLSVEVSTSITATATDTPMICPASNSVVRLFASPNMVGAYNVAVIVTVTPSTAGNIYFTPGQGGIL